MAINIEAIIYYLFLIDSIGANIATWCCHKQVTKWSKNNFKGIFKHLPITKGWSLVYLILVLWIGYALYRLGILPY